MHANALATLKLVQLSWENASDNHNYLPYTTKGRSQPASRIRSLTKNITPGMSSVSVRPFALTL